MKKYFMKDTEEELQFGDVIELSFTKDLDGTKIHKLLEVDFTPITLLALIEEGVVQEREVEEEELEEKSMIDFGDEGEEEDFEEYLNSLSENIEAIEKKVEMLCERMDTLDTKVVTELKNILQAIHEEESKQEKKNVKKKK